MNDFIDVNTLAKIAKIHADISKQNAIVAGMQAENDRCRTEGIAEVYNGDAFMHVAQQLGFISTMAENIYHVK